MNKKRLSPFYFHDIKIPRKLKKKVKRWCGVHYNGLSNAQRLWYYMEYSNPIYKRKIIMSICDEYKSLQMYYK